MRYRLIAGLAGILVTGVAQAQEPPKSAPHQACVQYAVDVRAARDAAEYRLAEAVVRLQAVEKELAEWKSKATKESDSK